MDEYNTINILIHVQFVCLAYFRADEQFFISHAWRKELNVLFGIFTVANMVIGIRWFKYIRNEEIINMLRTFTTRQHVNAALHTEIASKDMNPHKKKLFTYKKGR